MASRVSTKSTNVYMVLSLITTCSFQPPLLCQEYRYRNTVAIEHTCKWAVQIITTFIVSCQGASLNTAARQVWTSFSKPAHKLWDFPYNLYVFKTRVWTVVHYVCKMLTQLDHPSLVPRPPPFLFFGFRSV